MDTSLQNGHLGIVFLVFIFRRFDLGSYFQHSVHMLVEFMVMHDILLLYCVLDTQHLQVLPCSLLNKWDRSFSFQPFGLLKMTKSREKMFQSRPLQGTCHISWMYHES